MTSPAISKPAAAPHRPDSRTHAHPVWRRVGAVARWTLAVLACLWLALCTAVGPLYWDFENGTIANWNWTNTAIFAGSFVIYLGIILLLVRFAGTGRVLPTPLGERWHRFVGRYFTPRHRSHQHHETTTAVVSGVDSNDTESTGLTDANTATTADAPAPIDSSPASDATPVTDAPESPSRHRSAGSHSRFHIAPRQITTAIATGFAFLNRWLIRGTDRFWKIALILFIGWLWAPTTLLAAFGADIRSQIREFSWAWNQWTGLKQPYIGFFSFVPMDIYPTAHYMWPDNPTYLTDQHNVVLTVVYGAVAMFSRSLTGSNDAGIVALASIQMPFAVFCCAATAHRFLNRPWIGKSVDDAATPNSGTHDSGSPAVADAGAVNASDGTTAMSDTTITPKLAGGRARFLILLFFLACPLAVFATISITKSPLFAFAFVWWFGVWYELIQTWRPAGTKRKRQSDAPAETDADHTDSAAPAASTTPAPADSPTLTAPLRLPRHSLLAFIASTSVMLISAKYAWYIIALQIVLALIADRRRWATYVAALLIPTILIHGGISFAISSGAIIGGDPIESRGVQLQMIARVAQRNPDGISEEAKKNLSPVFNLDQMADAYFQQDADPVKSSGIQAKKVSYKWRTVTPEDMTGFNKAWLQIVKDNPVIALDALLAKCFGYFNVTDLPYVSMDYYVTSDYVQKNSTWIKSYHHDWREKVVKFTKKWGRIPVLGWLIHGNFYVVLTLLIGAAEVIRRRWLTLMTHIPLLLLMGVMITAPANNFERHMLPVAFVFGFMVLTYWRDSRTELAKSTAPAAE
nr:DUF6020 family protein [Bifidobacterium miconisargentati]